MLRLKLSRLADHDLESIVDYGTREYGGLAADAYYLDILTAFDLLCETPFSGQIDDDTKLGLRRWKCREHRIFINLPMMPF
jgi:plasmid stabilization system protein ParE